MGRRARPVQSGEPGPGKATNSMVAGINMAVFKNTKNIDGAKKFVKFMTSDEEQVVLNKAYGSTPPVKAAQQDPAFNTPSPHRAPGPSRPVPPRCRRCPRSRSSRPSSAPPSRNSSPTPQPAVR